MRFMKNAAGKLQGWALTSLQLQRMSIQTLQTLQCLIILQENPPTFYHVSAIFYGNGQNTKISSNHPCTIPLGIIVFGLSFTATFGTVERTAFGTFDQISDAGLAVVVKTWQDFGLLEMLRAYWAREFVVQFLEARGEQTLSHLA